MNYLIFIYRIGVVLITALFSCAAFAPDFVVKSVSSGIIEYSIPRYSARILLKSWISLSDQVGERYLAFLEEHRDDLLTSASIARCVNS